MGNRFSGVVAMIVLKQFTCTLHRATDETMPSGKVHSQQHHFCEDKSMLAAEQQLAPFQVYPAKDMS